MWCYLFCFVLMKQWTDLFRVYVENKKNSSRQHVQWYIMSIDRSIEAGNVEDEATARDNIYKRDAFVVVLMACHRFLKRK